MRVDGNDKARRRDAHGGDTAPDDFVDPTAFSHDADVYDAPVGATPPHPRAAASSGKTAGGSLDHDDDGSGGSSRRAAAAAAGHRATNIAAVTLLVVLLLASIVCVAAGACCLASLRGKPFEHFPLFFSFGVTPVVVGVVVAVSVCVVMALVLCGVGGCGGGGVRGCGGVKTYGMCCLHTTRPRAVWRVCVYGVLPFVMLIIVVVLAIAGFVIFSLSQQLPDLNADYVSVAGLRGPVEISRDRAGLTHIRARSRRDAYFAQGFAEAQDRLFQLEFHRLVATGELAAIAGRAALETDKAIRILNVRDAARALCANMGDDMRSLTQAFADGVNTYLQRERKRPVEFFFLGSRLLRFHQPAPFSYVDVCLTGRLFQWQMSSNMAAEYDRLRVWLRTNRSYNEVDELYTNYSRETVTILNKAQMTALMTANGDIPADTTADTVITRNAAAQRDTRTAEAAAYDGLFRLLKTQLSPSSSSLSNLRDDIGGGGGKSASVRRASVLDDDNNKNNNNKNDNNNNNNHNDNDDATTTGATMDHIRARVYAALHGDVLRSLGGVGSDDNDNDDSSHKGGSRRARALSRRSAFAYKFLRASNAWASRDASGHAVVASDAHLTVNLPSVWYYTHMSFPRDTAAGEGTGAMFDAAGVSLVGLPGVHIGRTTAVAWGITMSMTDLEDLYILPRRSSSSNGGDGGAAASAERYPYAGKTYDVTVRQERIRVKGGDDVVLEVRDTLLGPVINDLLPDVPDAWMVVLAAVPLRRDDATSMRALLGMTDPDTDSAEKMMNLLLTLQAPGFSIPIADTQGNIAYAVTGRHPRRNADHTGKFPTCLCNATQVMTSVCVYVKSRRGTHVSPQECVLSADDTAYVSLQDMAAVAYAAMGVGSWSTYIAPPSSTMAGDGDDATAAGRDVGAGDRFVPVAGNPHVHLPYADANAAATAAFVVAANHKIMPEGYTYHLGDDYAWSYRGQRIVELLTRDAAALDRVATHEAVQLDHRSNIFARDMVAVLQRTAFQRGIADDQAAAWWRMRLLLEWRDEQASLGSVEAAFFWRWMQRMSVLPRDALRALDAQHWPTEQRYLVTAMTSPTARMLRECASELRTPPPAATGDADACVLFAVQCFKEQVAAAASSDERWGIDVNHLRGVHELLQGTLLAPVFEREIDKAGDESSVCVSHHSLEGTMLSTQASSMRLLFDLGANATTLRFALPGGQSGNPYSDYYNNMLDEYAAERYFDAAATTAAYATMPYAARQVLQP